MYTDIVCCHTSRRPLQNRTREMASQLSQYEAVHTASTMPSATAGAAPITTTGGVAGAAAGAAPVTHGRDTLITPQVDRQVEGERDKAERERGQTVISYSVARD